MYKAVLFTVLGSIFAGSSLFVLNKDNSFKVSYEPIKAGVVSSIPEEMLDPNADLPNQKPLANPPKVIKVLYATGWSAGAKAKMDYLIDLIKKTEANSIIIDIKDYSGLISYDIDLPDVKKYKAKEVRIPKINSLIKRLHDEGIYVIARLTAFQDPILANARPDLAVKNKKTGEVWKDHKGISWLDPGNEEVWKYIVSIARDASSRGFDEINFDYIRFPSDGDLFLMEFPSMNEDPRKKSDVIRDFFSYLRINLLDVKISADLFGLTAINSDDLGIGQIIEHAYENFDYVAPMIYPSHFGKGFIGIENPGEKPYEVIKYSMIKAVEKLIAFESKLPKPEERVIVNRARLRPWLQDFNLGAIYDTDMVRAQITAVEELMASKNCDESSIKPEEILSTKPCYDFIDGWMMWDPKNNYTASALKSE